MASAVALFVNAMLNWSGEKIMPMKSKAQNRAMHAAAEGKSNLGIPKKVAKEFAKAQHGKSLKGLPEKKKAKK